MGKTHFLLILFLIYFLDITGCFDKQFLFNRFFLSAFLRCVFSFRLGNDLMLSFRCLAILDLLGYFIIELKCHDLIIAHVEICISGIALADLSAVIVSHICMLTDPDIRILDLNKLNRSTSGTITFDLQFLTELDATA